MLLWTSYLNDAPPLTQSWWRWWKEKFHLIYLMFTMKRTFSIFYFYFIFNGKTQNISVHNFNSVSNAEYKRNLLCINEVKAWLQTAANVQSGCVKKIIYERTYFFPILFYSLFLFFSLVKLLFHCVYIFSYNRKIMLLRVFRPIRTKFFQNVSNNRRLKMKRRSMALPIYSLQISSF